MKKNNPSKVVIIPRPPVASAEEEASAVAPKMAAPPTPLTESESATASDTQPVVATSIPKAKPIDDLQKKIDKTELPDKPIVE